MTVDPIIAVPAVLSTALIYRVSVQAAFFSVYLPLLMLIPDGYIWGWPPLNFHQYAIAPIGIALCWFCLNGKWRRSWTDIIVFSYVAWMVISHIHANGMADIGSHIAYPLTLAIFPYMAGKLLIEQTGLRVKVARRFAFFVFIDSIFSVYEFKFGVNPFRLTFGRLFSTVDPWFTQIRWGVGRVAGPFGHAILMGAIVAIAILLHRYVSHFGLWEKSFNHIRNLRLNKPKVIFWGLVAGSIMTISRGPWMALVVGVMLASVGWARNRKYALRRTIILLFIGGTLFYLGAKAYYAKGNWDASREEVVSAEYRTRLWPTYWPVASQQSFWGWGSPDWPKVQGMASIDNWYLLVTLMYGVTGLVLFSLMLVQPFLQLIYAGMFDPLMSPDLRALVFTMSGIILTVGVAVGTVFLGGQLYPLLFLFLGWSDACLVYRPKAVSPAHSFAFRRVIA